MNIVLNRLIQLACKASHWFWNTVYWASSAVKELAFARRKQAAKWI